jgi:[ribosomal protein S5]-alanine N-acetyltransferase
MLELMETARLKLASIQPDDAHAIQAIFPHWEVVRYLASTVPWPYPHDGAQAFCAEAVAARERGEGWTWTLRLQTQPDEIIGVIELMTDPDNNRGFWLVPAWHGQGLMTEACDAVTRCWFEVLNFPVLRAWKAVANEASRRISQRQGMRLISVSERDYVSGRLPAELWEMTAAEWFAQRVARQRAPSTHTRLKEAAPAPKTAGTQKPDVQ